MTQEAGVPTDFWGRIQQKIEDAVAKLARSGMLRNASISGGALTIKDGGQLRINYPDSLGGGPAVYFGDLYVGGSGPYSGTGLLFQKPDATDMVSIKQDVTSGRGLVIVRDDQENAVLYTDLTVGRGLARPYLPAGVFGRARYADWTVSTTSATFETLWKGEMYNQNPNLSVATMSSMDTSGETGEVRVLVNGVPLGTTASIGFAQTTSLFGPASPSTTHMAFLTVEIQGRRVSASGALRVEPLHWMGRA